MEEQNNNKPQNNTDFGNFFEESEKEKPKDYPEGEKEEFGQVFAPGTPKMVKWIFKLSGGKIKSANVANYILVVFAIIIFVISLVLFYAQLAPKKITGPSPEFLKQMQQQNGAPLPANNP